VLIYVDDVIIAFNDLAEIATMKQFLRVISYKILGELKYFLGIEVARSAKGIVLCQKKYAVSFPMESTLKLTAHDNSPSLSNPPSYRRLIVRLLYLTIT